MNKYTNKANQHQSLRSLDSLAAVGGVMSIKAEFRLASFLSTVTIFGVFCLLSWRDILGNFFVPSSSVLVVSLSLGSLVFLVVYLITQGVACYLFINNLLNRRYAFYIAAVCSGVLAIFVLLSTNSMSIIQAIIMAGLSFFYLFVILAIGIIVWFRVLCSKKT